MEITKQHPNNRICQHCGVKTSTVIPSFYYVFNISLSCENSIPSFIGNLWRVLLLGNHVKLDRSALSSRVVVEGDVAEKDEDNQNGIRFATLKFRFENKETVINW